MHLRFDEVVGYFRLNPFDRSTLEWADTARLAGDLRGSARRGASGAMSIFILCRDKASVQVGTFREMDLRIALFWSKREQPPPLG